MKYNTGDKVKLIDSYNGNLPEEMKSNLGKVVTIDNWCNTCFTIQEDGGLFNYKNKLIDKLVKPNSPNDFLKNFYSDFINDDISGFTTVMNIEYLNGKYDKCVHREKEINRLCEIILRKNKSNPVLTGLAGVGKTAIVEGFVSKITEIKKKSLDDNCINHPLINKVVLNINLTSMIAGMKYRGDFEERLRKVVDIAKYNSDVILFIDEIHMIIGLNKDNEGTISLGQLLKGSLSRGDISLIGATTESEYELIKKDKALDRRFTQINVKEFTKNQMKSVLPTICETYGTYHNINISDDVIKSALEYCDEFIENRVYPDKLIDVIDETAARLRLWKYDDDDIVMTVEDIAKTITNMTGKIIVSG